jgi:hypothetical protein
MLLSEEGGAVILLGGVLVPPVPEWLDVVHDRE